MRKYNPVFSILNSGLVFVSLFMVAACAPKLPSTGTPISDISYQNSLVTSSAESMLPAAQALITLSLKDTNFNPYIPISSSVVTFQLSGGTSTGTFGPVTDLQNGSYTSVLTAVNPGTQVSILAFVDGVEIQSVSPKILVLAANYSLSLSTLSLSQASVASQGTVTATLTVRDTSGNQITGGGYTVRFSNAGGTSTGTFGTTLDHGDGTYSSIFTGGLAGSATQIFATLQGNAVTSSAPSLTVLMSAPSSLVYSAPSVTYTVGTLITNNTPAQSGGAVAVYSVTPGLPTGLNLNTVTGVISGTPTAVTAVANYTVTATNSGGSTTASVAITVNDIPPSSLTYSTSPATYVAGTAITHNSPANSGGVILSYAVSPSLPAGLSLNALTGVISGTPTTASGAAAYTITGMNSGGTVTASLSIAIANIPPSSLTYSTNPAVYTKGTAIANNNPSNSGGPITSYSVSPSLPSGLSLNTSTGVIAGTPTAISSTTTYVVTGVSSGGNSLASVIITINDVVPSALTYTANSSTYTKGSAITANTPTSAGGAVVSYSISPNLPAGLSLNTGTGVISGTPTVVLSNASYTITALNSGGSTTASVSITVNDVAPSALTYSTNPATYTKSTAITSNSPTSAGGSVVTYSVSPSLPAGLSLSTSSGVIAGTPTAVTSVASYTVTATNSGGSTSTSVSITINDIAPASLTYSASPATYTKSSAITANSPTNSGGSVVGYSVSPSLPAGLNLSTSTGIISGTPTSVTSAANYTVTATNSGGSATTSVSITVNDIAPSSLTYSTSPAVYTNGTSIVNNYPNSSGGPALSYSVSPALPTGLSLSVMTGIISGTPTAITAGASYTVTATNSGGSTTVSISVTVNAAVPSSLTYSTNPATYTKGTAITANSPTSAGGTVISYSISPSLPAGLSLSTSTGIISGNPTAITSVTNYTVTATNSGGSTSTSVSITVNDVVPSALTYSTSPATYTKGTAITANSPTSAGGTVISYSISPSLPAGLSFNTTTGVISGTPTAVTAIANYTVTATNSGGSTTTSVSITVNDVAPSSITYSSNPAVYTNGVAIANNSPSNAGSPVLGYAVSPALPAGLSINTTTGIISGTPTAITAAASYTVTATNSGGAATISISITVNPPAPTVPTSLAVAAGAGSASLTWNAPSGSFGTLTYNILRGTSTGSETQYATSSSASYTDTSATTGNTYYYEVEAVGAGGTSANSSEVSATIYAAPGVATGLTAIQSSTGLSVVLSWKAPVGNFGTLTYQIYKGPTGASVTPYVSGVGTTTYTDTNVTMGSKYYYLIFVMGSGGTSSYSNVANVTIGPSACSLATSTLGSSGMQVYPAPTGSSTYLSSLYTVEVFDGSAWQPSYTYAFNRTSQTAWHQNSNPSANFTTFATSASSSVRITNLAANITSLSISPLSKNVTSTISGRQAVFTMNQNDKFWITVNGDDADPLFVFADGPKPVVPTTSNCSNFVYYGPGVTTINQYQATSGETIYIDGGAVVRGNINVAGTKNVQIVGPGILSGDLWTSENIQTLSFSQQTLYAMISGDYNGGDFATVSGITILDSPSYNFWGGANTVSGIKEISPWFYSTDGFEAVNHVDQVFAFVGDNVFFPSQEGIGNDTVTATNSFVGTTNDAVFNGGFHGNTNSSSFAYSSTMNNIDIKNYTNGTYGVHTPAIFQIWVDNNVATSGYSNQTYENIRIEGNLTSNLAELINMPYPTSWGGTSYNPALGNSYNFTFQNISLSGTQSGMSVIQGADASDGFHNVSWQNLSINGTAVTNSNYSSFFNVNSYIWGLNFQ